MANRFNNFLHTISARGTDDNFIIWVLGWSVVGLGVVGATAASNYEPPEPLPDLIQAPAVQTILQDWQFSQATSFSTTRNGGHIVLSFRTENKDCIALVSDELKRNNRGEQMYFPERVISRNPLATCS